MWVEELCHWWKSGNKNIRLNNLVEREAFINSVRVKSAELKDKFNFVRGSLYGFLRFLGVGKYHRLSRCG